RAFGIEFTSAEGSRELAWTTSWGSSTRMVGGLIMVHGDDAGLRVPPALAPTQVVVMAVKAEVVDAVHKIAADLTDAGARVVVDDRADIPFGRRVVDWELKGVPLRIELGPRDLDSNVAILARRLSGGKTPVPLGELAAEVTRLLADEQRAMLEAAREERDARIAEVSTVDDAATAGAEAWAKLPWAVLGEDGEAKLAESGVTVRCLQRPDGTVPDNETEDDLVAYVARSY
ncbi:MAG TPA: His/Gly/Thr/Pro-type tRNA ligase C-terminal domain-containing protein, partial [Jatrophihabitantaceae bacterium]|nr:His/Gly/Thr/Pro-type tRNA ligase C-terminal domain-containing protein [Jatrophihabitantaceae bacterium]